MRTTLFLALVAALVAAPAIARPGPGPGPYGDDQGRWRRGPPEMRPVDRGPPERGPMDRGPDDRPDMERPPPPRRSDQDYARDAMRAGAIRPLREIQRAWRMDMPGYDFIGSEYNPDIGSYRLKFMRGGEVVWVDVDGNGREIRRSGH